MANTKIRNATAVATPAATDEYATAQGSVSKRTTLAQVKTFVNTDPDFAAGSATAGTWPNLASGTVLTTAEKGTIEHDTNCFYGCSDAGNRGYIPLRHFIRCDSARTLPNDTNLNAIFNSPTNGRITLETGCYLFEMMLAISGMSGTSGNALINIRGAGTATMAAWLWRGSGLDTAASTAIADDDAAYHVTEATAASAVTAQTTTTMRFEGKGTFEVTGAGTVIPSIDLVTAAAASVAIGSYFMCERIGSTSVASVGQWD